MKNTRKYLALTFCAIALWIGCVYAFAQDGVQAKAPAIVYIIRHAEKPLGDKDPDLAPQGFKRAQALPYLFLPLPGKTGTGRLPKPDVLFATDQSKHSNRPVETVTPLAQALHLKIDHDYADAEYDQLAKTVLSGRYAGKVVLIAWHHGEIPHLAGALGVENAPKHWDPEVYDQIWRIEWVDGRAQMTTIPQQLLKGDSTQ